MKKKNKKYVLIFVVLIFIIIGVSAFYVIKIPVSCGSDWTCNNWSSCINSLQSRTCTDSNSCGTNLNKPIESQSCTQTCSPDWVCSSWSSCIDSDQKRSCNDINNCGLISGKPIEDRTCNSGSKENYLILTTSSLSNSLSINKLKLLRSDYNIITTYVDSMTPSQIKQSILSTNSATPLSYIVVIGSGTQIPTGEDGEYSYADMNGDGTPDVAYGRIPFSTETNLASLIGKEYIYETTQYYNNKKILLMAGDEAVPATGFQTATSYENEVIPLLSGQFTISKSYYGCGYSECMIPLNPETGNWGCDIGDSSFCDLSIADIKADKETLDKMNDILFMGFKGHGAWFPNGHFPTIPTFNFGQVEPYLHNTNKYFILNLQSCSGMTLNGEEAIMYTPGIGNTGNFATTLLAFPDKGSVAMIGSVISNSGGSNGFYQQIKTEKTLGKAWLKGSIGEKYSILGDPALTIN